MKCMQCGFDNEAREAYCRACGRKMAVSLDQVEVDLIGKADRQNEQTTEEEIRRWLVVAICLFLVALTAKVLFGPSTWPTNYVIPASGKTAEFATVTNQNDVPLKPAIAPLPQQGPK